jgi:hypothetical protein
MSRAACIPAIPPPITIAVGVTPTFFFSRAVEREVLRTALFINENAFSVAFSLS